MNKLYDFIFRNWFSAPPLTLPKDSLVREKHDQELGRAGRNNPETFKSLTDKMFPLTPAMINYWQAILKLKSPNITPGLFLKNWRALAASDRAFTNKHGWDSGDFRIENLICGGATRRLVDGIPFKAAGYWYYKVYALDPAHVPALPLSESAIDMTLCFLPTISTTNKVLVQVGKVKKWKGQYFVDPFPQFKYARAIVPYFGVNGVNAIRSDFLIPLKGNKIPSPFIP